MKLKDIVSRLLLPRFAHSMDWVQNAFDYIIKNGAQRALTLAAPLSMESIHGLTDSELQDYYEQFGVAIYYPDLSRETRETMLYYLAQLYRFLGTPRAVEILCQYIMDETEVHLHVDDHLAFDDNGNLVNESLLDVFDAELDVAGASLPEDTLKRIRENIIRFKNDRTELRGFSFNFDLTGGGLDSTISMTDGGNFETFYELNGWTSDIRQTGYPNQDYTTPATLSGKTRDLTLYTSSGGRVAIAGHAARYEVVRLYANSADIRGVRPVGLFLGSSTTSSTSLTAVLTNLGDTSYTYQRFDYRQINAIPYQFGYGMSGGKLYFTVQLQGGVTGSGYIDAYGFVRGNSTITDYVIIDARIRYTNGQFTINTELSATSSVDCYLNLTNLRPD